MSAFRECSESNGQFPCVTEGKEGCPIYQLRECFGPPDLLEKLRDKVWYAVIEAARRFPQKLKGVINVKNILLAGGIISATTMVIGAVNSNLFMFGSGFSGAALYNIAETSRQGWESKDQE